MFDESNPNTLFIAFGILAIIIEVIVGAVFGFELLVLGTIMIVGGVIGIITGSTTIAVLLIVVLLLGYVFVGRTRLKDSLNITTVKTNSDVLIGKTVHVTTDITPDKPGHVMVDGETWRAEADTAFKTGEKVTIVSLSGVTVRVSKQ